MSVSVSAGLGGSDLLWDTLALAVPMRIQEYIDNGGISDDDLARVRIVMTEITEPGDLFKRFELTQRGHSTEIGEKADDLLFGGVKKGEVAKIFNVVADSLAVLAFAWGGVKFSGMHFQAPAHLQLTPENLLERAS